MKLTVPICDAAGQPAPANCVAVHACRPLATPGESVVPTGSAISARLTCGAPFWRAGVTVAPLEVRVAVLAPDRARRAARDRALRVAEPGGHGRPERDVRAAGRREEGGLRRAVGVDRRRRPLT